MNRLFSSRTKLYIWSLTNTLLVLSLFLFVWGNYPPKDHPLSAHGSSLHTSAFAVDSTTLSFVLLIILLISTVVCLIRVQRMAAPSHTIIGLEEKATGSKQRIPMDKTGVAQKDVMGEKPATVVAAPIIESSSVQKRFLADVAHELGSPLARLQIGLAAFGTRLCNVQKERLQGIIDDVDHISDLVNELLHFSRTGVTTESERLTIVTLRSIVEKSILREGNEHAQIINDVPQGMTALAVPKLLSRAIDNLIRNAIKYAGKAGPVRVSAQNRDSSVLLSIQDHGPSVPEEMLDKIFEPFFRTDPARHQDSGGVGLGLAIVKAAIESCDGRIAAKMGDPSGLIIEITLGSPSHIQGKTDH